MTSWRLIVVAGLAAAVASALAQLLLWLAFTDALPEILYRDVRLTAAIVLGPDALARPDRFDLRLMVIAGLVHGLLSLVFAAVLSPVLARVHGMRWFTTGAAFGALLFAVNLYGFTLVFPWFAVARDWITFAAHLVFGIAAAAVLRRQPAR